jgi:hypothetical protein
VPSQKGENVKKDKFNLAWALHCVFNSAMDIEERCKKLKEILRQTGIPNEEFDKFVCHNHTIGNLKYRILGWMDKNKIDSSHII